MCTSGGDPHTKDFFGKYFDQHWEGTFYVFKYGDFEVQTTLKVCRSAQGWSSGRTICCNWEIAIQIAKGTVLRVAGAANRPTKNGGAWSGNGNAGGVSYSCSHNQCTAEHPDVRAQIVQSPPYSSFTVTLKKRGGKFVAPGRSIGFCGAAGLQQYSTSGRSKGYPCKTCIAGGAYRTVICKCEEFLVPQNKAITAQWRNLNKAPDMTTTLALLRAKSQRRKAGLTKLLPQKTILQDASAQDTERCLAHLQTKPYTAGAWTHCSGWNAHTAPVDQGQCTGHHYKVAKAVFDAAEACGGDATIMEIATAELKAEQVFCDVVAAEGITNQQFSLHHCNTIKKCMEDDHAGKNAIEAQRADSNENPLKWVPGQQCNGNAH